MSKKLVIDADTSWLEAFKVQHGSVHLLAMSRGKDALASWLVMRQHGIEVIPYHMDLVQGLEFVNESISQIEAKFQTKVWRIPHPHFFRMMDNLVFQPPDRIDVINRVNPKMPTYEQIQDDIRKQSGAPAKSLVGNGVRACDSPLRRISFMQHGHIRPKRETFFPVWNFRKADVMAILNKHGVHLPIEYQWFGRSFDGIDARFLIPIKKYSPRDYDKIVEWFPLVEMEVYRGLLR